MCQPTSSKGFHCSFSFFELGVTFVTIHLLPGPAGNIEFCFPSTPMFPLSLPQVTTMVSGKQNSLFSLGPVIKCLLTNSVTNEFVINFCCSHLLLRIKVNVMTSYLSCCLRKIYANLLNRLQVCVDSSIHV